MPKKLLNKSAAAFTLVEVLVAIAVLILLIALIAQLFSNASVVSSLSIRHLEVNARVQVLFARMSADFSRIVKRPDVDYFLKSPAHLVSPYLTAQTTDNLQSGPPASPATGSYTNDQMAFFSEVSGYSSVSDLENSVSLVAYRINGTGTTPALERLGTALSWGGGSSSILPVAFAPTTITSTWPTATKTPTTSATTDVAYDANYETIVPNAFRFEYYYLLTSGQLSAVPWDTTAGHTTINGLQDVAGIGIVLAVTDMKASAIVTSSQLQTLAGQMIDISSTSGSSPVTSPTPLTVGTLQSSWQTTVSSSTLSPVIKNGIRVYEHVFPIKTPSQ